MVLVYFNVLYSLKERAHTNDKWCRCKQMPLKMRGDGTLVQEKQKINMAWYGCSAADVIKLHSNILETSKGIC